MKNIFLEAEFFFFWLIFIKCLNVGKHKPQLNVKKNDTKKSSKNQKKIKGFENLEFIESCLTVQGRI